MRDIPPEVVRINQQLIDHFGIDTSTGQSMWRVVWTNDQYEKRLMDCDVNGDLLLQPEVREVSKYSYIRDLWILENLVLVPEFHQTELADVKLSYEPIFPFQKENGEALPPSFEASKFVIDLINSYKGKGNLSKYKETPETPEIKAKRIDKLCEELFGDENDTTDALAYREGVGYTGPSKLNPVKES